MAEKQRIYGERYPIDEDFLAALAHMPPASGAALGFDRLVMLATGAARIEQVLWTPVVGRTVVMPEPCAIQRPHAAWCASRSDLRTCDPGSRDSPRCNSRMTRAP